MSTPREPEQSDRFEVPGRTARPRRVLVVDDHRDFADILADVLRVIGHDVEVAYDAREALQVLATFQADVAFIDIGMPILDGHELATRLRRAAPTRGIRLIALTGYDDPQHRVRSLAAGFDLHLTKPIATLTLDTGVQGRGAS